MKISIETKDKTELLDITDKVNNNLKLKEGICILYCPHTTAALTINEGWDPDVKDDIINAVNKIVPDMDYKHAEGNSPAHIKSSLFGSSLTIIVEEGSLKLGRWQTVFFAEFDGPRSRDIYIKEMGK